MSKLLKQEYNRVFDNFTTLSLKDKYKHLESIKESLLERTYIYDKYQEWLLECLKDGDFGMSTKDIDTLEEFYNFINDYDMKGIK